MAKIEFEGLEEYRARLVALGADIESVCKYAVYDAAGIVIDAIKQNTPVDSGALRNSIKLHKFKNEDGFIYTGVYFEGYDESGTPNVIKARVLESGSSTQRKRPFVRPAVNRVRQAAETQIAVAFNQKIQDMMNGKD